MTRAKSPSTILLVEDGDSLRKVLGNELSRMGHEVHVRPDAADIVEVLLRVAP